jgi:threonine synthase
METTPGFSGLSCVDCGRGADPATLGRTCRSCEGALEVVFDPGAVSLTRETLASRRFDGSNRYRELLPFAPERSVTMDEGTTPLVDAPALADELGVERVLLKDEGANPTGSVRDRALGLAVTAARERDVDQVALPSTGPGAVAAAAYAARAGLECHAFVPSRSRFDAKARVNVHGGDMTVVGGRYADAVDAFESALADHPQWESLAPGSPYRLAGARTLAFEMLEQCDWTRPDAVVHPTGHGAGLQALADGFADLCALGLTDAVPRLLTAQPTGCAPVVEAVRDGRTSPDPIDNPDTVCGPLEVPDPAVGERAIAAVTDSGGTGAAVADEAALAAGIEVARTDGLPVSVPGSIAVAGARELAESGAFDADETVVVVDPLAGAADADLLRSYLMGQGE